MSPPRPPTEDDAAVVTGLMNEHWPEPLQEDVVRSTWSAPNFDLAQDARLEDGGYAHVEDIGDGRAWIDLQGRPSDQLVGWAEARASATGARRLLAGFWVTNDAVRDRLVARGYMSARHSRRMAIELSELIEEPVWPHGIEVGSLKSGEERSFYEAHQEAFEDTWEPIRETYDEWSHSLLGSPQFDPDLWFAGRAGPELGGIAICTVRPGDPDVGLVYILGVRRAWRGQGLGRALLLHSLRAFQRRGLERAVLGVDADNPTGAHRLYESVGMVVTAHFEIYERTAT